MITFGKIASRLGIVCAAAISMAATPAIANSAAETPVTPNQQVNTNSEGATALGESDTEFRTLFADWKSLDRKDSGSVSIPSRMPVEGMRLTSDYGTRSDPFRRGRRQHNGVDLAGPIGTPIYATADGIVSKASWFGGYGNYIAIEHGGSMQTRYGHMSRLNVTEHQRVKKGEIIGYMGSTGRSTGSHLHYEVRINGKAVNPIPFMRASDYVVAMKERREFEEGQGGPAE